MVSIKENRDIALVGQCLSGSEPAWAEFYTRFQRLVRLVVRRRLHVSQDGVEDVIQEVFMVLISALKNYNSTYSLQKYVSTIAERVCVDHYRFSTAAKRDTETEPFEDYLSRVADCRMEDRSAGNQEEELALRQQTHLLRQALRALGAKCRELLRLRYLEELPYQKISQILSISENTLTVQAARCVRELKTIFHVSLKKGARL